MDTQKWITQIDEVTSEVNSLFGNLSQEQLNWKPNTATWSIAQNIDHLIVINETYYPVVKSVRENTYKTPFIANIGFIVTFFGNLVYMAVQPDRKRKSKTFPIWEPSSSTIDKSVVSKFGEHQEQLKKLIVSSSDLLDKGQVISSPANKTIVYKLETAFDIIVAHEKRHLNQAKDLLAFIPV